MKELEIGSSRFTKVFIGDDPHPENGANHKYYIGRTEESGDIPSIGEFGTIGFQDGPIKENGVNGCHQEDLLAIVVHRLKCFQDGPFACRENALALTKIEEAMHWLNHRTNDRVARNVEGTNQK